MTGCFLHHYASETHLRCLLHISAPFCCQTLYIESLRARMKSVWTMQTSCKYSHFDENFDKKYTFIALYDDSRPTFWSKRIMDLKRSKTCYHTLKVVSATMPWPYKTNMWFWARMKSWTTMRVFIFSAEIIKIMLFWIQFEVILTNSHFLKGAFVERMVSIT